MFISSLHQPYPQHHSSRVRSANAEIFDHTSLVPGLSGARATIRRLLFCVLEKLGFSRIPLSSTAEQSFVGDVRVRTTSHRSKRALGRAPAPETPPGKRALERAPAPEPTPVERVLRRATAPRGTLA